MSGNYASAAAFRQALEARLRSAAEKRAVQIQGLRLKVAIERLLARLFAPDRSPWLLKGGYAMELRFRPNARTTRDVDLTMQHPPVPRGLDRHIDEVHELLGTTAKRDMGDFFEYDIRPSKMVLHAATQGGSRFPVIARVAGREFARFHIDVGFGEVDLGVSELLIGDDLLAFAGLPPARVRAIPKAQQLAEKVHAYTFPWSDRDNTRSRDLVDMALLIERGELHGDAVLDALNRTFRHRGTHALPRTLSPPPPSWETEFPAIAAQADITSRNPREAFAVLEAYWSRLGLDRSASD